MVVFDKHLTKRPYFSGIYTPVWCAKIRHFNDTSKFLDKNTKKEKGNGNGNESTKRDTEDAIRKNKFKRLSEKEWLFHGQKRMTWVELACKFLVKTHNIMKKKATSSQNWLKIKLNK